MSAISEVSTYELFKAGPLELNAPTLLQKAKAFQTQAPDGTTLILLRDEAGQHWLMTPQCRQSIVVEDAAFIAVDMAVRDGALAFRLNTDELVLAGPDHPLRAEGDPDCPAIYLAVRQGCEARLDRSTWLQLAEHALALDDDMHVVSQNARFSLLPA